MPEILHLFPAVTSLLSPSLLLLLLSSLTLTHPPGSHITRHTFPGDYLTPYPQGRHGSSRTIRDISNCLHTSWENRTFETFKVSTLPPKSEKVSYNLHKFADVTERPLGPQYMVGTIAYVEEPYHTFSVLEPGGEGGCSGGMYAGRRRTVGDTTGARKGGCKLAANAGFFVVVSGKCLGNVVSDGRVVETAQNQQNANFGIREDGTIVVGYIPDEEILDTDNPFRQLVTGVVWLVRNGTNFVNESKEMECSEHEDTGQMDTFVEVLSARSALGHDAQGRLVMAQIEGQTHRRGASLVEFADLLVRHGVVNAINLDGGGSSTLLEDSVLLNYPSDHCVGDGQYRCARAVSTALCVHDVQCLDPDCRGHGVCRETECECDSPWTGLSCETLNCSITNCSGHGNCSNGKCECAEGWTGELCSDVCASNRYGRDCRKYCWCYGNAHCHPTSGHCVCPPGFTGYTCMEDCAKGAGCKEECAYPDCSGHGHCSRLNGTCLCDEGWTGNSCNTTTGDQGSGTVRPFSISSSSTLPPSPSPSPTADSQSHNTVSVSGVSGVCDCSNRSSCAQNCSVEKDCNNTSHSSVLMEEDAIIMQWTVAITLLISLLTLLVHVLFCYLTRRWAYMAACRTQGSLLPAASGKTEDLLLGNKKKIKRRKPRPKYRAPLMLHYSSSTDCSL